MLRKTIITLYISLCAIVYSQNLPSVDYWKSLWPTLNKIDAGGSVLYIDKALIVDLYPEGKNINIQGTVRRSIGRIRISRDSKIYDMIEQQSFYNSGGGIMLYNSDSDVAYIYLFGFIPNTGAIYTLDALMTLNNLIVTLKYEIKNNRLQEVVQPLYYYEKDDIAGKDFDIFSEKELVNKVASITKGSNIEIIGVSKKEKGEILFLIKTPSGLLGWHKIEKWQDQGRTIYTLSSFNSYNP